MLSDLAIMLAAPSSTIVACFQIASMAVLGLATFREELGRYRLSHGSERGPEASWPRRIAAWAARALLMSTATTLIAGTLSSIPAAFHFGRLAPYGALANGLAVPVIGLLVMPAALLSAVLMPVGLEALPLAAMEQGLRLVLAISGFVAGLPGADMVAERPVASAILALAAGAVAGCLLVGRARLGGATVAACGLLLLLLPGDRPALLVERTGQNVALRDAAGRLVPALPRRASFSVSQWLTANGEEASPGEAAKRPGWTCAASRCDARVAGRRVAFLAEGEEDQIDCRGLDVLVAAFPLRGRCRAVPLRIDRFDVWKQGAHAVYFTDGAPLVRTARGGQGQRPWAAEPKRRPAPVGPSRTASSRGPR